MIGLIFLFVALMLFDTIVVNIIVALLSLLAVYELLVATGCWAHKLLSYFSMLFAAVIPFLSRQTISRNITLICYIYAVAVFCILLRNHQKLHIEQVALEFMFSITIPFSFSTLLYQRDRFGVSLGIFYVLLSLGGAFLSDTTAYFSGRAFGKHKMAPYISPHKTIEGAVGSLILAPVFMCLLAWGYSALCAWMGYPIQINYLALVCVMPVLTLASILGDLSASVIKRQFQVKDYGSIMPGHGGIMDRFDSVLMVAPAVYIISRIVPLAQVA